MLGWLRRAFVENLGLKLFALLLALILYRYVKGDQDRISSADVKLLLKLPPNMALVSDPVTSLRVTLRGSDSDLRNVDTRRLRYTLDLSKAKEGPTRYELYSDLLRPRFPPDVQVVRISPSTINLVLEKEIKRTLPIQLNLRGRPQLGYKLIRPVQFFPRKATVKGPRSTVNELKTISIEAVDLTGMSRDVSLRVHLVPPAKQLQVVGSSRVRVVLRFRQILVRKKFQGVRVRLVNFQSKQVQVTLQPKTVAVVLYGPKAHLHPMQPKDIVAEVDGSLFATKTEPERLQVPLRVLPPSVDIKVVQAPKKVEAICTIVPPAEPPRSPTVDGKAQEDGTEHRTPPPRRESKREKKPPLRRRRRSRRKKRKRRKMRRRRRFRRRKAPRRSSGRRSPSLQRRSSAPRRSCLHEDRDRGGQKNTNNQQQAPTEKG